MKFLAVLALSATSAMAAPWHEPAISPFMVELINTKQSSWVAEMSPRFDGMSKEQAKALCGTYVDESVKLPEKVFTEAELVSAVPDTFDARTAWPECSMIGYARDQANCG